MKECGSMLSQLFSWRIFPSTWISLLLMVVLFPLGFSLPEWWGWENGPIENTQVIILIAGAILSCLAARHNRHDSQICKLWLWTVPIWLIIIGRELSWGRVFFDPVSIGPDGPMFPSIHEIWYGRYVYPVNIIIMSSTLCGLWYNFNWKKIKHIWRIPAIDGILLILSAIASQLVFEKNLLMVFNPCSQLLEEWSELIVYWCMVSILLVNGFNKYVRVCQGTGLLTTYGRRNLPYATKTKIL